MSLIVTSQRLHFFPGMTIWTAAHMSWAQPIGHVYTRYTYLEGELEIVDSFVKPELRRQGVRTALQNAIWAAHTPEDLTRIVTKMGTTDGLAWMRSRGYQQAKDGYWYCTRKSWKASKLRKII